MMDAGVGQSPDQTLEPAMVIVFRKTYLGLESQQAELLWLEQKDVITRTSKPSNSET
jgi:hypothetical protein